MTRDAWQVQVTTMTYIDLLFESINGQCIELSDADAFR
jgi:hypothetical protein